MRRRSTQALDKVSVFDSNRGKFSLHFLGDFVMERNKEQLGGLKFVVSEKPLRLSGSREELRHPAALEIIV